MNELRILIIDDEENERDILKKIIRDNCPCVSEIFLGEDGEAGVEIYKKESPDIVFVDINMVGINGMEAIQKMQDYSSDAKFVIVTAYNLFTYAKEAIRLKVWDFLVKPVGPVEVTKIINEVASENEKRKHGKKYLEKLESINKIIEANFILSVSSVNYSFEISSIIEYFEIELKYGQVFIVKGNDIPIQKIHRIKSSCSENNSICLEYSSADLHTFVLLSQYPVDEKIIKQKIETLLDNSAFCVGVGYVYPIGDNLRDSFMQAMQACGYADFSQKRVVFFKDNMSENRQPFNIKEKSVEFANLILERKQKEALIALNIFLDEIQQNCASQAFLPNVFRLLMYICDRLGFTDETLISSYMQRLSSAPNRNVQREVTNQIINSMISELNSSEGYKAEELPHIIRHIIEQEYPTDLTLEDLSVRLSYSSYYLSRVFSKYYDKSFVEYLTEYRIERAKEIIKKNGSLSVKEISNSVGFHSQAYFARVFKKYCGVSPTEYK